jgi:uncharacterized protein YdaU (DUF1376 family)
LNYYEHRIRDYDAATNHLTWDQDLAYTRLIRWYYRKEKAIPADLAEACRQVRAVTKPQRDAVQAVLNEFFELRDDGWHKDDCDALIAAYLAGEPEREAKKTNEETRLTRHRQERAALFRVINGGGFHLPYNAPISEVRALANRIQPGCAGIDPATAPETKSATPATATATPATATQYPIPSTHSPSPTPQTPEGGSGVSGASPKPSPAPKPPPAADAPVTKAERGSRLPKDWVLPKAWGEWAIGEYPHWPADTVRLIAEGFRNHWVAKTGKDASKLDWLATWQNWCRGRITQEQYPPPATSNALARGRLTAADRAAINAAENARAERLLAGGHGAQEVIDA